ncbi:MAG: biotin/lipoyl-containing protein [Gaiellaceae bacterium]
MPALVDTSIRLLGQEPLAGRVPTGAVYKLAEVLDGAGFAYLDVSGGGCFEAAVRRGVESPWERIRAIKMRTKTPLALALRGRFLVGTHPVEDDVIRRFIACAAANGIDVFRLDDPLNDVDNLRESAEAVLAAGKEFEGGLVYSPGRGGDNELLIEQASKLPKLGAARVVLHDPTGSLPPYRAHELVERLRAESGLPVAVYCQGAGGNALASSIEAARAGAELIACSIYPIALTLHRPPGEVLAQTLTGLGFDCKVDVEALWQASDLVDEHIGDELIAPLVPRIAARAAEYGFPPGIVAALDTHLQTYSASDLLDDVLDELARIRQELGSPPLASPIAQILGWQALLHVLSANRYETVVDELPPLVRGEYGRTPDEVDPIVKRAIELRSPKPSEPKPAPTLDELRERVSGLAASDEELLLLRFFDQEAEPLLRAIRSRTSPDIAFFAGAVERDRAERIRDIVQIVQETGVSEVTIEDEDMRVTVRSAAERAAGSSAPLASAEFGQVPEMRPTEGMIAVESPMVGTFYRAPGPGTPPFVQLGDTIEPGQTLCILEAMKLMNEVKAEQGGIVRRICKQDGDPVQFGDLLIELEPISGKPLDNY